MTDFNDAINTSNQMRTALLWLAGTWVVATLIYGFQGVAA